MDESMELVTDALGLASKAVTVVAYDDRWPALFVSEAERINDAVAAAHLPALTLEHVGSTAVPGLAAKPVLDVAAGRLAETPASTYIAALESIGYIYRGDGGLPGRDFFRRGALRSHHLHLVERGGSHWIRYLRFRDALRGDDSLRDAYAELKRALAAAHPADRDAYMAGKTDFVEMVLRRRT